jgi:hypothetical protein
MNWSRNKTTTEPWELFEMGGDSKNFNSLFFFFQKWINIGALFYYCKGKRFDAVNRHR